jgi:hypothetical protein
MKSAICSFGGVDDGFLRRHSHPPSRFIARQLKCQRYLSSPYASRSHAISHVLRYELVH